MANHITVGSCYPESNLMLLNKNIVDAIKSWPASCSIFEQGHQHRLGHGPPILNRWMTTMVFGPRSI